MSALQTIGAGGGVGVSTTYGTLVSSVVGIATPCRLLVWGTSDAYVTAGVGATASTTDIPLPAYTPVLIDIPANIGNSTARLSAVQISGPGIIYGKPLSEAT